MILKKFYNNYMVLCCTLAISIITLDASGQKPTRRSCSVPCTKRERLQNPPDYFFNCFLLNACAKKKKAESKSLHRASFGMQPQQQLYHGSIFQGLVKMCEAYQGGSVVRPSENSLSSAVRVQYDRGQTVFCQPEEDFFDLNEERLQQVVRGPLTSKSNIELYYLTARLLGQDSRCSND